MAIGGIEVGQELLNVPMGEMIRSMAMAIADSQVKLDQASADNAELMSGKRIVRNAEGRPTGELEPTTIFFGHDEKGKPVEVSMLELGFTPTFYQFIDTIIDVKISITMTHSTDLTVKGKETAKKAIPVAATVSASYSSKYGYSVEGASFLRTKLVPVPPPAVLEERIRAMVEADQSKP